MSSYPTLDFPPLPNVAASDSSSRLGYSKAPIALPDSDLTLTPANVLHGISDATAYTGNRTLTLPSAADLVAAVPGAVVGTSVTHTFVNPSGSDVILALGAGGSLIGTGTVSAGTSGSVRVRLTNVSSGSEAYQAQRLS